MRFHNQIYYSTLREFKPFAYRSNFSIKLTLEGTENYLVNGQRNWLTSGQLLIVNNGSDVEGLGSPRKGISRGLSIFIEPELLSELLENRYRLLNHEIPEAAKSTNPPLEFHEHAFLDEKLSRFLITFTTQRLTATLETADYVEIGDALVDFKFRFEDSLCRTRKMRRSTQLEIFRRVNLARMFLHDSARTGFDLNAVSQAACMSKYFLIRCFKNITGLTPQQYHQLRRYELAKNLLRSGFSVTETTAHLGFGSVHYFSRLFKKLSGTSPAQWRRRTR